MDKSKNVSSYRWVILFASLPVIMSTEIMWLSLAPVSSIAVKFYGVSSMNIDLFAMSYMIMFILFSIPASWVIDKFGFRCSLLIGAFLTAVFGITRAVFADDYTFAIISQFVIAIGQPFILNISTKVSANWFPITERSTATGILTMAQYIGFTIPMLVSPLIAEKSGIATMYIIYAVIAVISGILAIVFIKEKPLIAPPGPTYVKEDFNISSIKKLFTNKSFMLVFIFCFLSIGVFNTILSLIETILSPRGITSAESGIIGAVFTIAGVVGAVILPLLSDKLGVRKPLWVTAIILLVPIYLLFTFISNFTIVAFVAGIAGFSIMGLAPIIFQYGAEAAYPAQEGTSLGFLLLGGQISGVLFVAAFEAMHSALNSVVIPMLLIVAITIIQIPISIFMKELKTEINLFSNNHNC